MANVTIESTTGSMGDRSPQNSVVFVSQSNGYAFYMNTSGYLVYRKTTDGGSTWGSAVTVQEVVIMQFCVYWGSLSKSSPNNLIHITYSDDTNNKVVYLNLDPDNSDSLSTVEEIVTSIQPVTYTRLIVCQNSNENVFILLGRYNSTTDIYKSDTSQENFAEIADAGVTVPSTNFDYFAISPHPTSDGDMVLVWGDESEQKLFTKDYDESANTWDSSWTTLDSAIDLFIHTSYRANHCNAVTDIKNSILYVTAINNKGTSSQGGTVRCYSYNGTSWSTKTSISDTSTGMQYINRLAIDNETGDVYALYSSGSAGSWDVNYKKSTDECSTWGSANDISDVTDDIRWGTISSGVGNGRISAVWYNDDLKDYISQSIAETNASASNKKKHIMFLI